MEFRILGPMQVCIDGSEVRIAGSRQRTVLAVLLLEANRVVSLDRLVAAVWDTAPPAGGRKLIRNAVSALRGQLAPLGPTIVTDDIGYRCGLGATRLDALAFAGHLQQGRRLAAARDLPGAAEAYRSALDLWRGRPLDGLSSPVIAAGAIRLAERWLTAYEEWINLELALGRHRDVIADLSTLVAEHPYRESLVGRLMLALSRAHRQADALVLYRRTRQCLVAELGVEPCADLRAIHEAILREATNVWPMTY